MTHVNIFLKLSNYQKQEQLGEGAYGKVYKIKDNNYEEVFAAKISKLPVNRDYEDKEETLLLFSEVNLFSALKHPAIIKFIGYSSIDFEEEPYPTMVTEFAPKGSLEYVLKNSSKLDLWDETKKLINIYGIASGMNYLHSNDITHHDLKPENILMDEKLQPKISDFGLSKMSNFCEKFNIDKSKLEQEKGTPLYTSPEIYLGGSFTKASDVYAYGLIVYQIMEDKPVFLDNPSFKALLNMINTGSRPEFTEKTPEPYRKLISKCWSQNPDDRPTFSEILKELKKCEFLTEKVDEDAFSDYVEIVDGYDCSFDFAKKSIQFEEFIQGRRKSRSRSHTIREPPKFIQDLPIKAASQDSPEALKKMKEMQNFKDVENMANCSEETKMASELAMIKICTPQPRKRRNNVTEPPKNIF